MTPTRGSASETSPDRKARPRSRLSGTAEGPGDGAVTYSGPNAVPHHLRPNGAAASTSPHGLVTRVRLDTPFTGLLASTVPRNVAPNLMTCVPEGVTWDAAPKTEQSEGSVPVAPVGAVTKANPRRARRDSAWPDATRFSPSSGGTGVGGYSGTLNTGHNSTNKTGHDGTNVGTRAADQTDPGWQRNNRRKTPVPPNLADKRGRVGRRSVFAKNNVYSPSSDRAPVSLWQRNVVACLEQGAGATFMTCVALWSLFGDDTRLSVFTQAADSTFVAITYVCLALFTVEMAALCVAKPGYVFGFYFWLDFVATASLLLDLPEFMYVTGLQNKDLCLFVLRAASGLDILAAPDLVASINDESDTVDGAFLRAARASRAGTRAGRIVRVVRLARVLRLCRVWHVRQSVTWANYGTREEKTPNPAPGRLAPQSEYEVGCDLDHGTSVVDVVVVKPDAEDSWKSKSQSLETKKEKEKPVGGSGETRVGQKLSELTTRRVILGVLGMVFTLPWFDLDTYPKFTEPGFRETGLTVLHAFAKGSAFPIVGDAGVTPGDTGDSSESSFTQSSGFYDAVDLYQTSTKGLYALVVFGEKMNAREELHFVLPGAEFGKRLRCEEFRHAAYVGSDVASVVDGSGFDANVSSDASSRKEDAPFVPSYAFFDARQDTQTQAALNMCRTVFVCVMLGAGALFFSRDAHDLVLKPIERMVRKVREVSENPLKRFQVDDSDSEDDDRDRVGGGGFKKRSGGFFSKSKSKEAAGEQMETRLLENSIAKICGLLAVGFGEAGSEIIAHNIRQGGAIDPMIPGRKMVAIFGFCDIRQFTDTTEVLQEGVMEFVNTIGKIVHMETHLHGGSANKNIGDAFLLVWKFPENVTLWDVENPRLASEQVRGEIAKVAENALASFVAIIAGLRRSAKLNTYTNDSRLTARMPGFQVNMGFGLHAGWAIEGAIGSEHKVDASYLSPNVNLSARLEAATKQFDVPILVSDTFVSLCGKQTQALMREIDAVTVKGSSEPMGVHTFDVSHDASPAHGAREDPGLKSERNSDSKSNAGAKEFTSHSFVEYDDLFGQHPDIVAMRVGVNDEFLTQFKIGFGLYKSGKWVESRVVLEKVKAGAFRSDKNGRPVTDGPSTALLQHMESLDWRPPVGWAGVRALTEK